MRRGGRKCVPGAAVLSVSLFISHPASLSVCLSQIYREFIQSAYHPLIGTQIDSLSSSLHFSQAYTVCLVNALLPILSSSLAVSTLCKIYSGGEFGPFGAIPLSASHPP